MNNAPPPRRLHRSGVLLIVSAAFLASAFVASVTTVFANSDDEPGSRHVSGQVGTTATLLSNLGQVTAPQGWESVGPENRIVHAQAINFTTGSNEDGYSFSAVTGWLKDVGPDDSPQVSIYTVNEYDNPAEILYTLSNPASFANDALNTFSAPANAVLARSTEYALVFENSIDTTDSLLYQVGFVDGNSVDANGAAGWSINTGEDYTVLFKIEGRSAAAYDGPTRSTNQPGSDTTRSAAITIPQNASITRNDRRLTVEWDAATDDGAKVLTGYRIRWKSESANWSSASMANVSAQSLAFTITGLRNGAPQDVRVGAIYDGSTVGTWSETSTGSPRVVAGAPQNLELRTLHERLKLSWEAPDRSNGHTITGYKVQWKTGNQTYDSTREKLVTNLSNMPVTITPIDNGHVHVARVSTMSGTTNVASSKISGAAISARDYIEDNIVQKYEDDHPWVRQAWRKRPLYVRVGTYRNPGFYVYSTSGANGYRGLAKGLRFGFSLKGYRSDTVVLHELAHHFTLDPRASDVHDAIGVGWLYFNHRVKGDCPVGEIYPDVLTYYTRQKAAPNLGYLSRCPEITSRAVPDAESAEVAGSVWLAATSPTGSTGTTTMGTAT